MTQFATLTEFFDAVLPFATPEEVLELRAKDRNGAITERKFFAFDSVPGPHDEADFLARRRADDLYFGCASRAAGSDGTRKGDAKHCHTAYTLWADFDFKNTPEDEARAYLSICPDPPAIVVHSGGGLHSYWILAQPIPADATLKQWLRDLAFTLHADPGAALITQILRVPGTTNWKRPAEYPEGRPVVIETFEPWRRLVLPEARRG